MDPKIIRNLLLAGSLACSVNALADGPRADMLSRACAGCHGTDGSSVGLASPTIAGMSEDYFIEAMEEYKEGERPTSIMERIARGYSDDEITAMAVWFAKKPFGRVAQVYDARKVAEGEKLHKQYCEKCHVGGGRLADGNSVLAGQRISYLRYSMADFLSGARQMPKKMKKRIGKVVSAQGNDGLEAIVQYYGSQQ
uniref:Cytochrome subunit of sulfide dehydrogenase n=1 Tax=Candidatus Kentrum sp. FM TaxID=2126340 RepID=A0A450WF34_9GAMM|nr:MAG: cytochrome subunit of sulfide dehydrogenase [Candidatus Kentron sp. FM]VFJ73002.1 MAG: cytochrome subunit of sulfide dehydrogenase [Candidatus Kentron sp. FM]VFK15598.1 MAG: cytochrome subunit of sulfide dehydrogenase [Candidatus Kentron sp. FM]